MTQPSGQTNPPGAAAGGLADLLPPEEGIAFGQAFPARTLLKVAILAALLVALNLRTFDWLVRKWLADPNWTHGFVIPLFSLYLLYTRREDLFRALVDARQRPAASQGRSALTRAVRAISPRGDLLGSAGFFIMLLGLAGEFFGVYPIKNYWISQVFMVFALFGLVLWLAGPKVIRVTWLPILFLIFAMPISDTIYTRISVPLQNLGASGARIILRLLGVQIVSTASALELVSKSGIVRPLNVAEACSGMRLLMAFLALGVAMAYLDDKPIWQRVVLVGLAVPIAVFCNVIRVAITAWMFYIDKEQFGQDFMHHFTGMLMLIPAFLMLWAIAWVLHHLYMDDDEPAPAEEQA
jgi:exosortase